MYSDGNGATSCKQCTAGKYQDNSLQTKCKDCPKGKYENSQASSGCKDCSAGQYQNTIGNSGCISCGTGSYQNNLGQQSCKSCHRGYYQDVKKQSACKPCASGRAEPSLGSSSCAKDCTCGYFCPTGSVSSTAEVCGEGYYCPTKTASRLAIGANQGTPVSDNPLRYCSFQACPKGHACENGVAVSNLQWTTPAGCLSNLHVTSVDEGVVGGFGTDFSATPHHSFDNTNYDIEYTVTKCPGNGDATPSACDNGRGADGYTPCPSGGDWLTVVDEKPTPGNVPSEQKTKLKTSKPLNAESCKLDYAATITARLVNSAGVEQAKTSCIVNIVVGNINEAPVLDASSISATRVVSETELPGFLIGDPLSATDAEVAVGLQDLTWSTTKCEALTHARTGTAVWEDVTPLDDCDIKLSACDGQLSVAERTDLNYEEYTQYRLKVKATDDGNPNLDSTTTGTVYIDVIEKNDPPEMDDIQYFYIKENSGDNTVVDLKNAAGVTCVAGKLHTNDKCAIMATDPDTEWTPTFKFIQDPSPDFPFKLNKMAIGGRTTAATYEAWTTVYVKLTAKNPVLDYELGMTQFDLTVTADDGMGGTSEKSVVTITIIDDNDKPYLNLPGRCDGKQCVYIDENNWEGASSHRLIDLASYTQDEDAQSKWECCRGSSPYKLLDAGAHPDRTAGIKACSVSDFTETSTGFTAKAERFNYETENTAGRSPDTCEIVVQIYDKGTVGTTGAEQEKGISEKILVRVVVRDINDPPHTVELKGISCSVDENTPIGQKLLLDACQLQAKDDDDTELAFLKQAGSEKAGTYGTANVNGATTPWSGIYYFGVGNAGDFVIDQKPDYETARSVTFDVYAKDGTAKPDGGRLSPATPITITIND